MPLAEPDKSVVSAESRQPSPSFSNKFLSMRAGISLGSNLGDRAVHLYSAVGSLRELSAPGSEVLVSSFHETEPVDCPPESPAFLNAAVEIEWLQSPSALLHALQSIEISHGRPPIRELNSPRPLDLDLLYCGALQVNNAELTLPHPRIGRRRFVLEPLAEIRAELILPGFRKSILESLGNLAQ